MHRVSSRIRHFRFDRVRRLFRWHARFTAAIFFVYFSFGLLWGPSWVLIDLGNKFEAIAETVMIGTIVPPPPSSPVIIATTTCDGSTPTVGLEWNDDDGTSNFDLSRDGALFLSGFSESEAEDRTVAFGGTYSYTVTAHGPMGSGVAVSDPVLITAISSCSSEEEESGGGGGSSKKKKKQYAASSIVSIPPATTEITPSPEIPEIPMESSPIETGVSSQFFPVLSFGSGILIVWADIVRLIGWIAFVSLFLLFFLLLMFLREYAMYAQSLVFVTEDMIGKNGYVRKEVKR